MRLLLAMFLSTLFAAPPPAPAPAPAPADPAAPLLGWWEEIDPETPGLPWLLEFRREDARFVSAQGILTTKVRYHEGAVEMLTGGPTKAAWSIEGDVLTIASPGEDRRFRRLTEPPALPDFSPLPLPEIEKDVKAGVLPADMFAMLFDRTRVFLGEKQRYGTQVGMNPETGELEVSPLEDEAKVDEYRKSLGLGPLKEYLDGMRGFGGGFPPPPVRPADGGGEER